MINEDRVKELYQMALYDENRDKKCKDTGRFFEKDYIHKQVIISFFTGAIAFVCMFILWAVYKIDVVQSFMSKFDTANIAFAFTIAGLLFLAFMIVYMFITVVVFQVKYKTRRRDLKKYEKHLKNVAKSYAREEKLKA